MDLLAMFQSVPLGRSQWKRSYAGGVDVPLINRFFEKDLSSSQDDTALLARPGTDFYKAIGETPMRGLFAQAGFMNEMLFVVANRTLYTWDGTTLTTVTGTLSNKTSPVSMTYQSIPGGTQRLWIADSENLWYYEGEAKANGTLTATAQPSAGDVVLMDTIYYEFVASGVDTGSPAGSLANPWRVLIGATVEDSMANLGAAVDNSGTPGSQYSTALTANSTIETRRVLPSALQVQARVAGVAGNSYATTTTSATMSWGAATLENGGAHYMVPVAVPEGGSQAAVTVTSLASYVIISVADSQRMYFIRPGEFWVEIFAEAESEPDLVYEVIAVGGLFWAMGESTIEPWSPTGDADIPFAPVQGRQLKFGYLQGTAQVIDDMVIYVDERGIVRNSAGQRLSTHSIEELIRSRG